MHVAGLRSPGRHTGPNGEQTLRYTGALPGYAPQFYPHAAAVTAPQPYPARVDATTAAGAEQVSGQLARGPQT